MGNTFHKSKDHCNKVRVRLAEHAGEILPERERGAVARHLEHCAACSARFAELRGAIINIQNMAADDAVAPVGKTDVGAILQKANAPALAPASGNSWWRTLIRFAPLAAAIFLISVFAPILYRSNAQQKELRDQMKELKDRVAVLEGTAPRVLESTKAWITPALRDMAGELDDHENRVQESLRFLARAMGRQNQFVAENLAGEIETTKQHLEFTQNAVLRVAEKLRD
ncbi:MAG: hypothetical protein HY286_15120 [Planctomycetes bacterium]|nr:hypothetical protein [Planctomycetota bacterium]